METSPFTLNLKDPTPSLWFCMDLFTVLPQCSSSSHIKAIVFKAVAALEATSACFTNGPVCNDAHVAPKQHRLQHEIQTIIIYYPRSVPQVSVKCRKPGLNTIQQTTITQKRCVQMSYLGIFQCFNSSGDGRSRTILSLSLYIYTHIYIL